jgi:hypothetical protein
MMKTYLMLMVKQKAGNATSHTALSLLSNHMLPDMENCAVSMTMKVQG